MEQSREHQRSGHDPKASASAPAQRAERNEERNSQQERLRRRPTQVGQDVQCAMTRGCRRHVEIASHETREGCSMLSRAQRTVRQRQHEPPRTGQSQRRQDPPQRSQLLSAPAAGCPHVDQAGDDEAEGQQQPVVELGEEGQCQRAARRQVAPQADSSRTPRPEDARGRYPGGGRHFQKERRGKGQQQRTERHQPRRSERRQPLAQGQSWSLAITTELKAQRPRESNRQGPQRQRHAARRTLAEPSRNRPGRNRHRKREGVLLAALQGLVGLVEPAPREPPESCVQPAKPRACSRPTPSRGGSRAKSPGPKPRVRGPATRGRVDARCGLAGSGLRLGAPPA